MSEFHFTIRIVLANPSLEHPTIKTIEISSKTTRKRTTTTHPNQIIKDTKKMNQPRSSPSSVPPSSLIHPSTPVSIILKADQPTGHQVQGFVSEILTRGDHPRGIKVRLRDGRVGRVQRVCGEEEARAGSEGLKGLGENGETTARMGSEGVGRGRGRGGRIERDFRTDGYVEPEREEASLLDYMVTKKTKSRGKGKGRKPQPIQAERMQESHDDEIEGAEAEEIRNSGEQQQQQSMGDANANTTTCPVCGEFEGDADAVAHHVNGHFD